MAHLTSDGVGDESIPELVRLGEQLTRAREGAGLTLDALANRLRVEPQILQALEQGDHHKLPEGVFIVALARRIAGTLNVNLDEGITNVRQSRLMEHKPGGTSKPSGDPSPLLHPGPPQAPLQTRRQTPTPSGRRSPLPLWGWPIAALLTALGATAAWLLLAKSPSHSPSAPPRQESTTAPAPGRTVHPTSPAKLPTGTAPAQPPTGKASLSSTSADALRLQASEPSWLEVRDANGKTLFEGTLSGEKSFPLGRGLEVMAGRPYAVRASIGSGQPTPIGGVDDIRWKRFSPEPITPAAAPPPTPSP